MSDEPTAPATPDASFVALPLVPEVAPEPLPSRRGPRVLVVVVVFALFVGIGASAYYYWRTLSSPERAVTTMMEAMMGVSALSFHITGEAEGAVLDEAVEKQGKGPLSVVLSTDVQGVTSGDVRSFALSLKSNIDDVENDPFTVEYRAVDDVSYFSITSIPGLGDTAVALHSVTNRWVLFDPAILGQGNLLADSIARLQAATALTAVQRNGLRTMLAQNVGDIFALRNNDGTEERNGVLTNRYSFAVSESALLASLAEMGRQYPEAMTATDQAKIAEALSYVNDITGEMWISDEDNYLRTIRVQGTFAPQSGPLVARIHDPFDFSLTLDLSEFNTPVTVETPENSATIMQILTEAAAIEAENADDDADGLTAKQEAEYGTDPAKADSDGDGYNDGAEVTGGYNPIGDGTL